MAPGGWSKPQASLIYSNHLCRQPAPTDLCEKSWRPHPREGYIVNPFPYPQGRNVLCVVFTGWCKINRGGREREMVFEEHCWGRNFPLELCDLSSNWQQRGCRRERGSLLSVHPSWKKCACGNKGGLFVCLSLWTWPRESVRHQCPLAGPSDSIWKEHRPQLGWGQPAMPRKGLQLWVHRHSAQGVTRLWGKFYCLIWLNNNPFWKQVD